MRKRLIRFPILPLLAVSLLAVLALGASVAAAQAPPAPPARFLGTVTVNGAPAATGTTVTAMVGTATCGTTTVATANGEQRYTLDVPALDASLAPGCGTDNATVTFIVGGKTANETGSWKSFQLNQLNLTVSSAASATPTKTTTPGRSGDRFGHRRPVRRDDRVVPDRGHARRRQPRRRWARTRAPYLPLATHTWATPRTPGASFGSRRFDRSSEPREPVVAPSLLSEAPLRARAHEPTPGTPHPATAFARLPPPMTRRRSRTPHTPRVAAAHRGRTLANQPPRRVARRPNADWKGGACAPQLSPKS